MTTTAELAHCPPSETTVLERTRFFPRQLVTPDDLTQDQRYVRDKLRRHNRFLHGWGVVCGAGVRQHADAGKVVVEPGYILGPWGDEIVIDREVVVDLSHETTDGLVHGPCVDPADPWCTSVRVERRAGAKFYLAVRYDECDTRPVRVATDACGCNLTECQYSRTRDGYALKLLTALPASYTARPTAPSGPGTRATTEQRCITFDTPVHETFNTRVMEGIRLETAGSAMRIIARGSFVGLEFPDGVRVTLPEPTARVTFKLVHQFDGVRVTTVHQDGSTRTVPSLPTTSSDQSEQFTITGTGITNLVLVSKQGLLLELCYEARVDQPAPRDEGRSCPPCPADPWVILAGLSFKSGGEVDTLDPDEQRRWVVSVAGRETIGAPPTAEVPGGATPGRPGGTVITLPPGFRPFDIGRVHEVLDRASVRRWQEEHGGDPGALGELPITALKGIGAGLGRAIGRLGLGDRAPGEARLRDVADTPRDEFIARVLAAAPPGTARADVERRATEAWTRAREITGRG